MAFTPTGFLSPVGVYTSANLPGFITGSGSLQVASGVSTGLWTGLGANYNWSTAGNWNQSAVPIFPIGLTFAGSTRLVNNNDLSGITASSITFDSAAGAFVLDGNGLTLSGNLGFNGDPAAPVTQTVNLNMALSASETIDTPANGNLTFDGGVTSSVDTSLIKLDSGTLTLGGTNAIVSWDLNGGTTVLREARRSTGMAMAGFMWRMAITSPIAPPHWTSSLGRCLTSLGAMATPL